MKKVFALQFFHWNHLEVRHTSVMGHNLLTKVPNFNDMKQKNRFQAILEFLHLNDNSHNDVHETDQDHLYKVCPLVVCLVATLKTI